MCFLQCQYTDLLFMHHSVHSCPFTVCWILRASSLHIQGGNHPLCFGTFTKVSCWCWLILCQGILHLGYFFLQFFLLSCPLMPWLLSTSHASWVVIAYSQILRRLSLNKYTCFFHPRIAYLGIWWSVIVITLSPGLGIKGIICRHARFISYIPTSLSENLCSLG